MERRRVLPERIGYERFLAEVDSKTLDKDRDPGGERQLLSINLGEHEELVLLSVMCSSTGRHYLIRVPENTETCHAAGAWIAGYDEPDDYRPEVET